MAIAFTPASSIWKGFAIDATGMHGRSCLNCGKKVSWRLDILQMSAK
ncbi:hypothetical protein [Rhizobium azibense]|nr:hypothetical protein [Rhizobium azibense]